MLNQQLIYWKSETYLIGIPICQIPTLKIDIIVGALAQNYSIVDAWILRSHLTVTK